MYFIYNNTLILRNSATRCSLLDKTSRSEGRVHYNMRKTPFHRLLQSGLNGATSFYSIFPPSSGLIACLHYNTNISPCRDPMQCNCTFTYHIPFTSCPGIKKSVHALYPNRLIMHIQVGILWGTNKIRRWKEAPKITYRNAFRSPVTDWPLKVCIYLHVY